MKKVTVSKLQIAQAKECSRRADRYTKGIEAIIDMCEIVLPISQYNIMPKETLLRGLGTNMLRLQLIRKLSNLSKSMRMRLEKE